MNLLKLTFITTTVGAALSLASGCSSDEQGEKTTILGGNGGDSGGSGLDGGAAANGNGGMGQLFDPDSGIGNEPDAEETCGGNPVEATVNPVNILIVMDKSKSMIDNELSPGTSRWDGVKTALQEALTATQAQVDFGISLFPYDPNGGGDGGSSDVCVMPAATDSDPLVPITAGATDEATTIGAALDAQTPDGGTPTAAALSLALDYFTNGAGATLDGNKYVLLATDGGPNCNDNHPDCAETACTLNIDNACTIPGVNCCTNAVENCLDDAETEAAVTALANAGIGTFVVGMPGSEAYETTLNALATAGGFPQTGDTQYFSVSAADGVSALTATFQNIAIDLITECELQLEEDPPNLNDLNVDIDGVRIERTDAQATDGWYLNTDTSPPTVVLVGSTCDGVKSQGAESLEVIFGCPPIIRR